jgi:hypothetical protein
MLHHSRPRTPKLVRLESSRIGKRDWLEPKLGISIFRFDMDVRRLVTLVAEKEESQPLGAKYRRHGTMLTAFIYNSIA